MREGSVARGDPSSARGSNFAVHPRVETDTPGSTLATMTPAREGPTVHGVKLVNLRELPPIAGTGPPVALRIVGFVSLAVVFLSAVTTDPTPGLHGDGPWVALGIVLMAGGVLRSLPRRELPDGQRLAALVVATIGVCLLTALQPHSAAFAGIYYVVVIAGMRLDRITGVAVAVLAVGALVTVMIATGDTANGAIPGLIFSVVPWFLIMRLVRRLVERGREAEALVEELRESRAAHAESVAISERSRVARDMHDVLAHSLSALALQLEGARLLARDRGADPEVVEAVERAHHLAAGGLAEARQAIGALRGDELPGPERLPALVDAFRESSDARCELRVTGTPLELPSEARLALYRTAQEALTNIRRHSAADRVEIDLRYAPDGTTLVVQDHGPGAPVTVGATTATANGAGAGGGYGLTGMRERAELLGGRLCAEPTGDGFRVELWLPA
jgi:signal transduction histidine kinase